MQYRNTSNHWAQAGDVLVPPGGLSPDLKERPEGHFWVAQKAETKRTPAPAPAPEPKGGDK